MYEGIYSLGRHLLIELKDCNPNILSNTEKVKNILISAAKKAGAIIIDVSFHKFYPFGISGFVVIAESHLSIHTWPEYNYAAVDIFTCGNLINPQTAAQYLIKKFKSRNPSVLEIKRGIIAQGNKKLPHKSLPLDKREIKRG